MTHEKKAPEVDYYSRDDAYGLSRYWIPTSTALPDPDEEGDVIVCFSGRLGRNISYDHVVGTADYYGDADEDEELCGWDITGMRGLDDLVVHAWMPAPDSFEAWKDGGCDDEHTQEEFEFGNEPYCDDDGNNL